MERIRNVEPKEYGGTKYRSTLEADTAKTLDLLNIPYNYEGRRITLLDGFRCAYQNDKVKAISYTPDFEIGDIILECKGFETPEWKLKRKYLFKYLMENEPKKKFYQIHDCGKSLLQVLDRNWLSLEKSIEVCPTKNNGKKVSPRWYLSVSLAMEDLGIREKPLGKILSALTGKIPSAYGYTWRLVNLFLDRRQTDK